MTKTYPVIGLFDSGVGGLSVLQKLLNTRPSMGYVYLADSAYFPYSLQPADFIEQRVLQLCDWMENTYQLDALVMACNTASATTYADLVEHDLPFPVYEPIGVTCDWIKQSYPDAKNIVVLATPVTIATNAYLTNLSAQYDVTQLPSAELVQAVERGNVTDAVLAPLMQVILSHKPDVLVLGSTHFSWAAEAIAPYVPELVQLVDSAHCLAAVIETLLPAIPATQRTEAIITTTFSNDFNQFIQLNLPNLSSIPVQVIQQAAPVLPATDTSACAIPSITA